MKRKQFTFYESILATAELMEENEQGPYLLAISRYGLYGMEPDISNLPRAVAIGFLSHKPTLDSSRVKAKNGKKGGESKQKASEGKAKRKQTQANPKLDIELERELDIDIDRGGDLLDKQTASAPAQTEFEIFFSAYPCKIGMDAAFAVWHGIPTAERDFERIMSALSAWKASARWQEDNGRYIPRAARWLKEKHWLNPPAPEKKIPNGAAGELGEREIAAIHRLMQEG